VRATKTAAPYDAPSWHLSTFLPVSENKSDARSAARDDEDRDESAEHVDQSVSLNRREP
jgi:hypothetical protein